MNDENHEHDRFLKIENGMMHFGCINPFCGHGSPALPKHWEIPMETKAIRITEVSHNGRMLTFMFQLKIDLGEFKRGDFTKLVCPDNIEDCMTIFGNFFAKRRTIE